MKQIDWGDLKNEQLRAERGISFEEVQAAILSEKLLDDIEHFNPQDYPAQRLFIVRVGDCSYVVPYVQEGQKIFLKTVYPREMLTNRYIK